MRIQIQARPGEMRAKSGQLLSQLEKAIAPHNPGLADVLRKAGQGLEPADMSGAVTEPQRAMQELRAEMRDAYQKQMQAMLGEIGQVLDQAASETPAIQVEQ